MTIRTVGSISFKLISVLWFFVIIWFAHILQRLISFLFGETGSDIDDDITTVSKGQHSRLLITRLLVLTKRIPVILYTKVTPETLSLTVRCWSAIGNVEQVKSEAMLQLSAAFSAKSIGFE